MSILCPICETKIELIPDGKLRYCQCQLLGVDHTNEYTRYLGINPYHQYDKNIIKEIRKCLKLSF